MNSNNRHRGWFRSDNFGELLFRLWIIALLVAMLFEKPIPFWLFNCVLALQLSFFMWNYRRLKRLEQRPDAPVADAGASRATDNEPPCRGDHAHPAPSAGNSTPAQPSREEPPVLGDGSPPERCWPTNTRWVAGAIGCLALAEALYLFWRPLPEPSGAAIFGPWDQMLLPAFIAVIYLIKAFHLCGRAPGAKPDRVGSE